MFSSPAAESEVTACVFAALWPCVAARVENGKARQSAVKPLEEGRDCKTVQNGQEKEKEKSLRIVFLLLLSVIGTN